MKKKARFKRIDKNSEDFIFVPANSRAPSKNTRFMTREYV